MERTNGAVWNNDRVTEKKMKRVFDFTRSIDELDNKPSVTVFIRAHKYDEGFGPIVERVKYDTPIRRGDVMETIREALIDWYRVMGEDGVQTVKVWVTGRPGRWIGNGQVPTIRLA